MASHKRLPQRHHVHIRHPSRRWMPLSYTLCNAGKLLRRLLCAHAKFEPGKYGIAVTAALSSVQHRHGTGAPIAQRQPELGVVRHIEPGRHDTDDLEDAPAPTRRIDPDGLADYILITTESFPPVAITDNGVTLEPLAVV